jgi:hypothetical protein
MADEVELLVEVEQVNSGLDGRLGTVRVGPPVHDAAFMRWLRTAWAVGGRRPRTATLGVRMGVE